MQNAVTALPLLRQLLSAAIAGLLSMLLLESSAQAQEIKSSLTATDSGLVNFMSANRRTTFGQVYQKKVAFDEPITGDLRFPGNPAPGKLPAVVIMHSSAGVGESVHAWAQFFNDMGLASLAVDSFKPRGIQRSVEDQNVLSFAASAMDSLKALELLATHPAIDAKRIAIIGFSRGGGAGLHASFERVRQGAIKDDTRYAIHFLFYPSCSEFARTTGAPLHAFLGSDDAYNSVDKCRFNVNRLKSLGAHIDMTVYQGAKHGFDAIGPANLWIPLGTTAKECETGSQNLDTGISVMQDGRTMPTAEFIKLRTACLKRGFAVGSDPEARERSREAVRALLKKQFGL